MKKILLLGGFGFIGTNIMKYVDNNTKLKDKFKFIILERMARHPHGIIFKCIFKIYVGDFSDETFINKIFIENDIDFVIHSLSTTVPATSTNARFDVESNLISTLKLLGIMDKHNIKNIVYISSGGAIYGDTLQKVHNEEDAVYPKSSYGIVKLAIEKYLLSYSELYGFQSMILRLSNPFGKYHYNQHQGVINIALRKLLNKEPLEIWGTGDGIKDYIFIEDFCSILFRLIENDIESCVYNIGGSLPLSVNEICKYILNIDSNFEFKHVNASAVDVQSFELDITKIRKRLGKLSFKKTYEWQKIESEKNYE